jgi:Flp pilus assembly protein TadD
MSSQASLPKFSITRAVGVVVAVALAGCATNQSTRTPVRIEIQEKVGFTITEDARVSNGARTDYDAALNYLELGRHDEGIALLEAVADGAPELSAPRVDLGIAHHRAGNLEAAEANLLLALESNPDHPIAHNELGIIYRKAGRIAEARQSYEAALAIYPGYHYARRNLAVLCDLYLADLGCALENYEAYMATVSSDAEAEMWMRDIRSRLGQ